MSRHETITVTSSISVDTGCEMYGVVYDGGETMFVFGGQLGEAFNLSFEREALRQFVQLASLGLRDMDQRQAEEDAGLPERVERTRLELPAAAVVR